MQIAFPISVLSPCIRLEKCCIAFLEANTLYNYDRGREILLLQNNHVMAEESKEKALVLHEATSSLKASLPKNISFKSLILELLSIVDYFCARFIALV